MTETSEARPIVPTGKPAPLLPPDSGRDRPLFFVAAILVFLACLAAIGARGAWTASAQWTADLQGAMTLQIRPVDGRDAQADAEAAAELATGLDGISGAHARTRAQSESLLAPWLGNDLPSDIPVPILVDIVLDNGAVPPVAALQSALEDAGIVADVDDHARWIDAVARTTRLARLLALGLLALIVGAAAAVIAFAARASLAARRDVADALHLVGAEDSYIAALFERRFFTLGMKAGLAGALFAAAITLLVAFGGGAGSAYFLPVLAIQPIETLALLAAPLIAGLIASLSARLAVAEDLKGRW
jgi:cell division transport system permease protein|tara:strand:+ start:62 stop:970 length:909 start_codon:yes stop_codon:yes gene_type:complete